MRIVLCKDISYCGGVKRALNLTYDRLKHGKKPIYSLGQLIHNPSICDKLLRSGLTVVESPEGLSPGTVIIRAHGVPDAIRENFIKAGFSICDATCPIVKHNLEMIGESAHEKKIVIIGQKNHDEVKAMCGVKGIGETITISSPEDIPLLSKGVPYAAFVQTTFASKLFDTIMERIIHDGYDVSFMNKLCPSSINRRMAVSALAASCSAVLIVGGRNSANTCALLTLVERTGKPCWLVENEEEITEEMVKVPVLGLASGASTSMEMIDRVKKRLEEWNIRCTSQGN